MAKARKPISTKTRFEIFKRDKFTCAYCGAHPPMVILHVDHIIPVFEGGGNGQTNLITSCDRCNLGKGARSLDSVPQSLADKAQETKERELQIRGYSEIMEAQRERVDSDTWVVANVWTAGYEAEYVTKADFESMRRFVEKLGVHECIRAMQLAVSKRPYNSNHGFKYFCGICWNILREGGLQ